MTTKVDFLKNLINDGGRHTFASVQICTDLKMNKKNNPYYGRVQKKSSLQISLNAVYSNLVNSRLEKEGKENDFIAKENWHTPVFDGKNGSLVAHREKGGLYLKVIVNKVLESIYILDGREATTEEINEIKSFIPVKKEGVNQGLDNPVIVRVIALENILQVNGIDL